MNRNVIAAYDASREAERARPPHAVYADLTELMKLEFKASGFSFLPKQPVHSILAGRHASRLRGRGLNFEEIRRYLPGDDIRNMDWRVTARLQKPHVRVYTEERDRPCILVVDQRRGMFFGSRRCMKSVAAAEAAALAAWRSFNAGDRVGAIIFDDHNIAEIAPHRSRQRVMEVLNAIVEKNHALGGDNLPPANPHMITRALESAARLAKHDCLVILIAGAGGADDDTARACTRIANHNDLLTVYVYDPMEKQLPDERGLVLSREGLQLEIDGSEQSTRKSFESQFEQRMEWFKTITRQREAPLLPISTEHDVARQVRDILKPAEGR